MDVFSLLENALFTVPSFLYCVIDKRAASFCTYYSITRKKRVIAYIGTECPIFLKDDVKNSKNMLRKILTKRTSAFFKDASLNAFLYIYIRN